MAFPTTPTDGQTATVNNIVYVYSTATNTWTRTASGFVTLAASGNVSAGGNVVGNYILGNGSQLTSVNANTINTAFNGSANTFYLDFVTQNGANSQAVYNSPFLTYVPTTGVLGASAVSATGNVTGNYILGNGALLTGVSTSSSNINSGNSNVTVTSSGGNVTVGIGGTANVAVFASTGEYVTGVVSASGNITGNYFIGNGSLLTGITGGSGIRWTTSNTAPGSPTPGDFWYNGNTSIKYQYTNDGTANYWIDQSYPSSFSTIAVSGNATIGGTLAVTGNLSYGNISTAGLATITGNITGGNILTAGLVSATGNVTGGNITTVGNVTGNYILGNGALLTGVSTSSSNINNGTSNVTVLSSGGNILVGVGGANIVRFTSAGIENAQANATGNIGNSTSYFNTVFAKATSAQYADLAEMYVADQDYTAGTVVEFGGAEEITATTQSHSVLTVGIISTNPSYLMNATQEGDHVLPVALIGRVPCYVIGPISRGDRLVASGIPGVAQRLNMLEYQPGCIIGKALEEYISDDVGTIEVLVGKI